MAWAWRKSGPKLARSQVFLLIFSLPDDISLSSFSLCRLFNHYHLKTTVRNHNSTFSSNLSPRRWQNSHHEHLSLSFAKLFLFSLWSTSTTIPSSDAPWAIVQTSSSRPRPPRQVTFSFLPLHPPSSPATRLLHTER